MYHDYQQFAVSRHRQASDGQGGGVMLLFHPRYRELRQTIPVALTSYDAVAVVDAQDGHCWVLVYLPDSRDVSSVTQVCVFLDYILSHHTLVTIMGDFNMNQIDWQCDKYMNLAEPQLQFLRFCQLWDLQEIVKAPMRDRSCLDNILTTNSERFGKVTIVAPINSDHDTVLCEIWLQRKSFKSQLVRLEPCFQIADYGAISHVLMSTDWRLIFNNCITVNDYWMALYTYLTQLVHRFVPFKRWSDHGKQGQIARPVT